MLAHIIAGTPIWVPVVLLVLLVYGTILSRTRNMNTVRVAILPVIMILLSIAGVFSSFGSLPAAMGAWMVGFGLAVGLNQVVHAPAGVTYDPRAQTFHVPGSWVPLGLMMAIFFAKYVVGAMTAMQPAVVATAWFAAMMSLVFGCLSGTFFARSLQIWSTKRLLTAPVEATS